VHKEGSFRGGLGQQLLPAFLHFGTLFAGHFPCRQGRLPTGVKVAARDCFTAYQTKITRDSQQCSVEVRGLICIKTTTFC
jgi:hypothetical protein